ncbi:MAG TPA: hypothetical protein VFO89_05590, partial [Thermoanaerobaculia bacterium]|nr:hypothetical protein [Thermoanaerobaculia bacterium]
NAFAASPVPRASSTVSCSPAFTVAAPSAVLHAGALRLQLEWKIEPSLRLQRTIIRQVRRWAIH